MASEIRKKYKVELDFVNWELTGTFKSLSSATAVISCECQVAGGERLLFCPCAGEYVIRKKMSLQGEGEVILVKEYEGIRIVKVDLMVT